MPFPADDELVDGLFALEGGEYLTDALGEDVDALDDDDFIGTAPGG